MPQQDVVNYTLNAAILPLPAIPAAVTEWSPGLRVGADLNNLDEFRLSSSVGVAYPNDTDGAGIRVEWVVDFNGTWAPFTRPDLGDVPHQNYLEYVGCYTTAWMPVPAEARGPIFLRWVTLNGNGTDGATVGIVSAQFR